MITGRNFTTLLQQRGRQTGKIFRVSLSGLVEGCCVYENRFHSLVLFDSSLGGP
jgi:hypothetical protein